MKTKLEILEETLERLKKHKEWLERDENAMIDWARTMKLYELEGSIFDIENEIIWLKKNEERN